MNNNALHLSFIAILFCLVAFIFSFAMPKQQVVQDIAIPQLLTHGTYCGEGCDVNIRLNKSGDIYLGKTKISEKAFAEHLLLNKQARDCENLNYKISGHPELNMGTVLVLSNQIKESMAGANIVWAPYFPEQKHI